MIWKPVPGYEGYYAVSDKGTIYSLRKERELKPKVDRYGYEVVTLTVYGHSKCFTVHRLVALAFIPNPYNKPTVNHKDENKRNNIVSNLEWATVKENDNHGSRNARMAKSKCRRAVEGNISRRHNSTIRWSESRFRSVWYCSQYDFPVLPRIE